MEEFFDKKASKGKQHSGNRRENKKDRKEFAGVHGVVKTVPDKEGTTNFTFTNPDDIVRSIIEDIMETSYDKVSVERRNTLKEFIILNEIMNFDHLKLFFESPQQLKQALALESSRGYTQTGSLSENKPYIGRLDPTGLMEKWKLSDEGESFSEPDEKYLQVVHMTTSNTYFKGGKADLTLGTDGEFGGGFYTVTGHQEPLGATSPQGMIRTQWRNKKTLKAPDDMMYFKIDKRLIRELVDDDETCNFVLYMMKHPSGYPPGMSDEEVINMIEKVNKQGKILLFPDDKQRAVLIDESHSMSVEDFEGTKPRSEHILVVGPQKPPALAGLRQIAFRNVGGDILINSAERFWGTYNENAQASPSKTSQQEKKKTGKEWTINKNKPKK